MYAIETKKRKFDRLLESLHHANTSKTSLTSLTVDANDDRVIKPNHNSKKDGSISSKRLKSSDPSTETLPTNSEPRLSPPSASKPRPNYLPVDRSAFLERLLSFRDLTKWKSGKPEAINEVEWAKRGWSCVGVDRVACVGGCNKQLVVRLAKQGSQDVEKDPDDTMALEEGHGLDVAAEEKYDNVSQPVFGQHPIPAEGGESPLDELDRSAERTEAPSIHRLPLTNTSTSIANLQMRYLSLKNIESEIPSEVYITEDLGVTELGDVLRTLYTEGVFVDNSGRKYNPNNLRTFALALCGWQGEAGHVPLAECKACFRRLGLWTYRPAKEGSLPIMSSLQAVDEHLDYCPWKNGEAQAAGSTPNSSGTLEGGRKPGWLLLLQQVTDNGRRRTKTREMSPAKEDSLPSPEKTESRDSKTRELVRKVRDLTRGLKVKGLVRKKRP